jgi:hypothetical protein
MFTGKVPGSDNNVPIIITSIRLYFLLLGPFIEDISISLWNLGISEAILGTLDLRGQQCDDYISGVGPRDFPEGAIFLFLRQNRCGIYSSMWSE